MAAALCAGCSAWLSPAPSSFENRRDFSIVHVAEGFDLDQPGEAWTFRTPALWRVAAVGDRRFLQMAYPPQRPLLPGVRRPQEYALHGRFEFRSFSLACSVRVDRETDVKGRDACILFGRQDDTHFYYAHLSNYTDAFHNNLVRVDGSNRQPLLPADPARRPAITDQEWHLVEVLRNADTGSITVYVDRDKGGLSAFPLFEVADRTYEWGFIGLGSFDDHASFGRLAVEGQARTPRAPPPTDRTPSTAPADG